MKRREFADDLVGREADGVRVGANERAAKNPRRPVRDVVVLQLFQKRSMNLRLLRDRGQRNLLAFTLAPQTRAEALRHGQPYTVGLDAITRIDRCRDR